MASDPYASYNPHEPYNERNEPVYNPYSFTAGQNVHNEYNDTGYTGYRDDASVPPEASDNTVVAGKPLPLVNSRNTSYSTPVLRDNSSGAVKSWRRSEHRNLWTKGSRGRCFCRFFGCTVMTIIVLFISIVLTLGLWVKPPDITFNGVNFVDAANKVTVANGGFTIPLTLNISVNNPNFFSATFSNISATATYPGTSISVGGGHETNVKFPADTTAFLQFPFTVTYSVSDDTDLVVLKDLANKCGVTGSSSNIVVDYVLKLKIRVVAMISPSFSATASFPCPLTAAEIESLGGGLLGGT